MISWAIKVFSGRGVKFAHVEAVRCRHEGAGRDAPGRLVGLGAAQARGPVRVIDSDLATVTADADKVLLVEDPTPWILHVELQAKRDPSLEWRVPSV